MARHIRDQDADDAGRPREHTKSSSSARALRPALRGCSFRQRVT
jgi:hypothetical protein